MVTTRSLSISNSLRLKKLAVLATLCVRGCRREQECPEFAILRPKLGVLGTEWCGHHSENLRASTAKFCELCSQVAGSREQVAGSKEQVLRVDGDSLVLA